MDVTSIMNNELRTFMTDQRRHETEINNFKSLLDKSMAELGLTEKEDAELRNACETFESYFLQIMFREMRKTSFNDEGLFAKSNAERIFIDMMDEEVSKAAAKSGGIGLADMMYKQMTMNKVNKI